MTRYLAPKNFNFPLFFSFGFAGLFAVLYSQIRSLKISEQRSPRKTHIV